MGQERMHAGKRILTTTIVTAMMGVAVPMATVPTVAYAATEKELEGQLEETQASLDQANDDVKRLETEIKTAEKRIVTITKQLPNRRENASETMKALYKEMSTHNLQLGIILNSDNVQEVMDQLIALEDVQNESFGQINNLTDEMASCAEDNVTRQEELELAKATVITKEDEVEELEARLERVRNAPPNIEGCEPIDWSLSDDEIVAEWAPRIDAYLEGHGLEGQGETFVKAAIKYGVDPRFSVAISNTESTRGDFEFRDFNSWGWMTSTTFSSYSESIPAHVEYLAGPLYHGQLTAQTAQTYCPPTWQSWLANTLSAAQSI